jgi:very-short-patch-repair endonuclease
LCLSVNGVASHRCAAYLWGFRKFETPTVEVLTRRTHTPSVDGPTIRRTRRLVSSDVDTCLGLPITSRARTLLDLCAVSPYLAEGALNGALHKRQVTVGKLQATLDGVTPRHPGAAHLRDLLRPFTAGQRPTGSELEDDFLELVIRKYDLPMPVRQHPVGRRSIDFAYPDLIFGIEIDSVRGHAAREDVDRNASKANELLDWSIAHFVYNDIHRWPEDTAAFLRATIARRHKHFAA